MYFATGRQLIVTSVNYDSRLGVFRFEEQGKPVAEVEYETRGRLLVLIATHFLSGAESRMIVPRIADAMLSIALEQQYTMDVLCPYMHHEFSRHAEKYRCAWMRGGLRDQGLSWGTA